MTDFVGEISNKTGVSIDSLISFAKSATFRYKVYTIPKHGTGYRLIEQPSKSVKSLQRVVVDRVLRHYPVHGAATAYRVGVGLRANVEPHTRSRYISRFDFTDFFHSFSSAMILGFFKENPNYAKSSLSDRDMAFIVDLSSRQGRLAIGAPISPTLTNVLLDEFDRELTSLCETYRAIYTRYADDIYISSNYSMRPFDAPSEIERIARATGHGNLKINHRKTRHMSTKGRRRVTGLIVDDDGNISLGRDRKRLISSLVHKSTLGELSSDQRDHLRGMIAFSSSVEPDFVNRLRLKYPTAPFL